MGTPRGYKKSMKEKRVLPREFGHDMTTSQRRLVETWLALGADKKQALRLGRLGFTDERKYQAEKDAWQRQREAAV